MPRGPGGLSNLLGAQWAPGVQAWSPGSHWTHLLLTCAIRAGTPCCSLQPTLSRSLYLAPCWSLKVHHGILQPGGGDPRGPWSPLSTSSQARKSACNTPAWQQSHLHCHQNSARAGLATALTAPALTPTCLPGMCTGPGLFSKATQRKLKCNSPANIEDGTPHPPPLASCVAFYSLALRPLSGGPLSMRCTEQSASSIDAPGPVPSPACKSLQSRGPSIFVPESSGFHTRSILGYLTLF